MSTSEMSLYKDDQIVYSQGDIHSDWLIDSKTVIKPEQEIEYFYIGEFNAKGSSIVKIMFFIIESYNNK
jgi:hypothetical protein